MTDAAEEPATKLSSIGRSAEPIPTRLNDWTIGEIIAASSHKHRLYGRKTSGSLCRAASRSRHHRGVTDASGTDVEVPPQRRHQHRRTPAKSSPGRSAAGTGPPWPPEQTPSGRNSGAGNRGHAIWCLRLATASGISSPTGDVAEWLKAAVC
jgi:hypothetical protein